MFRKVLIANRGEIAVRIMRTARRMGIRTVAVTSEADRRALFAHMADEAVEIGPPAPSESYLRGDRIIDAALKTGADCIHPGYGFLAENADFAEAVARAGMTFIGPSPLAMRRMGDKAEGKAIAAAAGVPVVPGSVAKKQDLQSLAREARRLGYPVMIKAAGGGGGRGMRTVADEEELGPALESARREAEAAFGDGRLLLEKLISRSRHIEVQVFADRHGNFVHLFERDCSLQRRHQKVIEEAPAPGLPEALRRKITQAAVACAKAVAYENAGTVEFLVEGGALSEDSAWYFIEMNTRLQVEHPVTEAITGLDLVEWQFRVAAGEPLPLTQGAIAMSGHAIEARLNAEDAAKGFLPAAGSIVAFETPAMEGLRIDAGVTTGSTVPPYYDSLLAKLIAVGPERAKAIARLKGALEETIVAGPKTNAAFLHALLGHPDFLRAEMDTGLIGRELDSLTSPVLDVGVVAVGAKHMLRNVLDDLEALRSRRSHERHSPWNAHDGFQLGGERRQEWKLLADGAPITVEVRWGKEGPTVSAVDGRLVPTTEPANIRIVGRHSPIYVLANMRQIELRWPEFTAALGGGESEEGRVRAPINGRVAKLFVKGGETVAKGERIAIIEAMKMEHVVHAPCSARIEKVAVREGMQVNEGALIALLERHEPHKGRSRHDGASDQIVRGR
jgi:3-methylcrotonyl-CoA carboxylase alpha subunit